MRTEIDHLNRCPKILFLNNGVEDAIKILNSMIFYIDQAENNTINVLYLSNMIREFLYITEFNWQNQLIDLSLNNVIFHFAGAWASELEKRLF